MKSILPKISIIFICLLTFSCSKDKEIELPKILTSISFAEGSLSLEPGQSIDIPFTYVPAELPKPAVDWKSSNPEIVTIKNGKAVAVKEGKAIITVTAQNSSISQKIIVNVSPVQVSTIAFEPNASKAIIGSTLQLNVKVYPENAGNKNVKWSSNNHNIATVDSKGLVTTYIEGQVEITAISENGNKSAVYKLDVSLVPISKIQTSIFQASLFQGDSKQVTTQVFPVNAENPKLIWESADPTIATVDQNGQITAVSTGTVQISVKSESNPEVKTTIIVQVYNSPNELIESKITEKNYTNTNGYITGTLSLNLALKNFPLEIRTMDVSFIDRNGKTLRGPNTINLTNTTPEVTHSLTIIIKGDNPLNNTYKPTIVIKYNFRGKTYIYKMDIE